jgi:hypothetical protein
MVSRQEASPASAPKGFGEGDSFVYDGNLDSLPDWADKGWATYDRGPALAVPKGDPNGHPYTTDTARIGDTVFANKRQDRFTVVRAEELGEEPGDPNNPATTDKPLPHKPVGTAEASLEDLNRSGVLPYEEMNPEQQAQMVARGTAPQEATEAPAEAAPTSRRKRGAPAEE